jgi:hypothetical protein
MPFLKELFIIIENILSKIALGHPFPNISSPYPVSCKISIFAELKT